MKGNYDEGFGGEQHKNKWLKDSDSPAQSPIDTPTTMTSSETNSPTPSNDSPSLETSEEKARDPKLAMKAFRGERTQSSIFFPLFLDFNQFY